VTVVISWKPLGVSSVLKLTLATLASTNENTRPPNRIYIFKGVGALDFGVYIAPRIYLSYGIGVFDRDNIISARYDLKRGFGVRTSSGRRESGVDVSYRLDK